jgi:predicted lipopolysaccharide heptosyltransferase III
MGDAVLMTPALRALKKGFPGAEIHLVLDQELTGLFEDHPFVDRVFPLGRSGLAKMALAVSLRRSSYDAVVNFHGGPTSAWLTAATGARVRVGRDSYRFGFVYNKKVPAPEVVFDDPSAIHTVQNQASLVTALGLELHDSSLHLSVSAAAEKRLAKKLKDQGVPESGYVVFQPTASFPTKSWPVDRFLLLARELAKVTERDIVVSLPRAPRLGREHGPLGRWFRRERETPSDPTESFEGRYPLLHDLPLGELAALMKGAAVYVGNDAGPMHIAAATGTPVVGIFGSSDPKRWHPWGVAHRVLWAGLDCSPCHGKFCVNTEQFTCLTEIEVKSVLDATLELLESSPD